MSGCACDARWCHGIRIEPVDRPCCYHLIAEANLGKSIERIGGSNRGTEQEIASVLGDLVDHPAPAANARAQRSAAIAIGPDQPFVARHYAAPRFPQFCRSCAAQQSDPREVGSADKPDPCWCSKMSAAHHAQASQTQPLSSRDAAHLPDSGCSRRLGWAPTKPSTPPRRDPPDEPSSPPRHPRSGFDPSGIFEQAQGRAALPSRCPRIVDDVCRIHRVGLGHVRGYAAGTRGRSRARVSRMRGTRGGLSVLAAGALAALAVPAAFG